MYTIETTKKVPTRENVLASFKQNPTAPFVLYGVENISGDNSKDVIGGLGILKILKVAEDGVRGILERYNGRPIKVQAHFNTRGRLFSLTPIAFQEC